ncbi:MAG: NIPSNAP family protein [Acidobacteriota bacterium]|nr:MAG: NIPSNAP family protein [Acidobacteriota bacterium]
MTRITIGALALVGGLLLSPRTTEAQKLNAQIYELRIYHTNPGLLKNLHTRFKEHTNQLFVKHGMRLIGYWVPADEDDTLIYILAFPSAEAREKAWTAFTEDPEWQKVRDASHEKAGGPIVDRVESTIMFPTDYSPIR